MKISNLIKKNRLKIISISLCLLVSALILVAFLPKKRPVPIVENRQGSILASPVSSFPPSLMHDKMYDFIVQRKSWDELIKINKETVGWLYIPDTQCNLPVMLPKGDKERVLEKNEEYYYLYRDVYGKYDINGTLFIDFRCDSTAEYMSQNTTIYGHNMLSGSHFGQLSKYRKLDFYRKNPVIRYDTPYKNMTWKVFAIFVTNTIESQGKIFDYRQPEYEDFPEFIKQCKRRSLINCPVDVNEDDRIITLSTCTSEIKNARFVVMARKTREDEGSFVDVSKAEINKKILYPDGWYRVYGGKPPVFPEDDVS